MQELSFNSLVRLCDWLQEKSLSNQRRRKQSGAKEWLTLREYLQVSQFSVNFFACRFLRPSFLSALTLGFQLFGEGEDEGRVGGGGGGGGFVFFF